MAFTSSVYEFEQFSFSFPFTYRTFKRSRHPLRPNGRTLNYERAAPAHGVLLGTNVGVISSVSPPTAHKGRMIKVRSFHPPPHPSPNGRCLQQWVRTVGNGVQIIRYHSAVVSYSPGRILYGSRSDANYIISSI